MQVNHKNGVKTDNRPENLEYVSCQENIRHAWKRGLCSADHCRGERNNKARLTAENIRTIRSIYPAQSLKRLAATFGITPQAVWHVVHRKTWQHVA